MFSNVKSSFPDFKGTPSVPSAAVPALDNAGVRTRTTLPTDLRAAFELTLGDETGLSHPAFTVPPRIAGGAIADSEILDIMATLKPEMHIFTEVREPEGGRSIDCTGRAARSPAGSESQHGSKITFSIDRNNWLQEFKFEVTDQNGPPSFSARFQKKLPSAADFQTQSPSWLQGAQSGSIQGHKRTALPSKRQNDSTLLVRDDSCLPLRRQTTNLGQKSMRTRALEEGDVPRLHDPLFNCIPATCFEIGTALAILDKPGDVGKVVDHYAQSLSKAIHLVYETEAGLAEITLGGRQQILRQLFDTKLMAEFSPHSDQVGRCLDKSLAASWMQDAGKVWLNQQLTASSKDNGHLQLLTKLRSFNAFGAIIWESLIEPNTAAANRQAILSILPIEADSFDTLLSYIRTSLAHDNFNQPETRARTERAPIIMGKSLGARVGVKLLADGRKVGGSFGRIYHTSQINDEKLRHAYAAQEKEFGRQGMHRVGDPIVDRSRPGLLSEFALEAMPSAFHETGLAASLEAHRFPHGSGTSRWVLHGTQAKASWENDMPAAGAHSLGAVVMLLGMGSLDKSGKEFFGNPHLQIPAGLAIAAFMNFSGYHSFVETFPIASAAARRENYEVPVGNDHMRALYDNMTKAVQTYAPEAHAMVAKYQEAYRVSMSVDA